MSNFKEKLQLLDYNSVKESILYCAKSCLCLESTYVPLSLWVSLFFLFMYISLYSFIFLFLSLSLIFSFTINVSHPFPSLFLETFRKELEKWGLYDFYVYFCTFGLIFVISVCVCVPGFRGVNLKVNKWRQKFLDV